MALELFCSTLSHSDLVLVLSVLRRKVCNGYHLQKSVTGEQAMTFREVWCHSEMGLAPAIARQWAFQEAVERGPEK